MAEGANPLVPGGRRRPWPPLRTRQAPLAAVCDLRRQGGPRGLRLLVRRTRPARWPRSCARPSRSRSSSDRWPWSWRSPAGSPWASWPPCTRTEAGTTSRSRCATVGVAVPNFVLAVFLIILFSFVIPLFRTGGLGLAERLGAADGHAGAGPDGHHRALHPGEHAGGHPGRLHADRARQGPERNAGDLQARAQERADPGRDPAGAARSPRWEPDPSSWSLSFGCPAWAASSCCP